MWSYSWQRANLVWHKDWKRGNGSHGSVHKNNIVFFYFNVIIEIRNHWWREMLFLSLAEQRQRQEDGHQKLTVRTHTTWINCLSLWQRFQWFYNYCNLKIYRLVMQELLKDFSSTSRTFQGTLWSISFCWLFILLYRNFLILECFQIGLKHFWKV